VTRESTEYQWLSLDYPEQRSFNEVYGFAGSQGQVHLEAVLMRPPGEQPKTLFFFMHPVTPMDVLPVPRSLVSAGFHVLCARTRYFRNDSVLIFEKALLDFGAWIKYARTVLGYGKVVLVGWSGGGSLAMFYQAQAENPTIVDTPYGDPVDLVSAGLIPGDALIFQAAHSSRARVLLESLDPSVRNETAPDDRDPRLDLYDPANPVRPPYEADFIADYRAAQLVRMRRITADVEQVLSDLRARRGKEMERGFVVHRTMADPRWIDPLVDPNDRKPNWCLSGDPETVNAGPVGYARFCTLRSWLSQWSIDDTRADAIVCATQISVPVLAIENTADDGVPASHVREVYAATASKDKEYLVIPGANHYYAGTPDRLAQATQATIEFAAKRNLVDSDRDEPWSAPNG
jgi:pimeloyl-ACP methyl ester carboxylesterase